MPVTYKIKNSLDSVSVVMYPDPVFGPWKFSVFVSSNGTEKTDHKSVALCIYVKKEEDFYTDAFRNNYPIVSYSHSHDRLSIDSVYEEIKDYVGPGNVPPRKELVPIIKFVYLDALREYARRFCLHISSLGLPLEDCVGAISSLVCEEIIES